MFNDLDKSANTVGKTILAFSDTIETRVRLQKIYDPGSKTKLSTYQLNGLKRSAASSKNQMAPVAQNDAQADKEIYTSKQWSDVLEWDYRNLSVVGIPDDYFASVELRPLTTTANTPASQTSNPVVVSLRLALDQLNLAVGETELLRATPLDADGKVVEGASLEWKSLNNDILDASAGNGAITGVKPGVAILTITSDYPSDLDLTKQDRLCALFGKL